jgi:hypothetical protein
MKIGTQAKIGVPPDRKVYAVDLFCGAGGLTHGLIMAGINVRLGVDIDPACEHPYVANNNARFLLKSVEELDASELDRHYRKNGIKLLAGCAPCQTFSTYNQKATESDKRWWLLWNLDDVKRLHRVAVRTLPDSELRVPAVAVWSRLVITGGDHHRLHEELTLAGGELEHKRFARISQVGKLEALVAQGSPIEPDQTLFEVLKDRFERFEDALMAAVEARSRDRLKFLENTLVRRMKSEIADVLTILDDLEASIRKELNQNGKPVQLSLFSDEELGQIKKDTQALEARLARIPDEREAEKAAIERHYANPVDRTFPVAVIFLLPASLRING